jgi:hypothetical protein
MNNGYRAILKPDEHISIDPAILKQRERRMAKSQELRRKDNGNFISSIYPPELALARPRHINENIERELVEFMQENEEKFRKSKVNQNFVFPRKYDLKADDPIPIADILKIPQSTSSVPSHRRYKSQENKYAGNFVIADHESTRQTAKNFNILQQTINITGLSKAPTFKFNISHNLGGGKR